MHAKTLISNIFLMSALTLFAVLGGCGGEDAGVVTTVLTRNL